MVLSENAATERRGTQAAIHALHRGPYWAAPKIFLDLILWIAAATLAISCDSTAVTILAVLFIGTVPMHDLLVHGHDSTHRLVARTRWINEFFLWFNHALVGLSGSAYRAFHLDHHRWAHTGRDPEIRLLHRLSRGRGWGYLLLPLVSHAVVNTYPLVARKRIRVLLRGLVELMAAGLLHAALFFSLGTEVYLLFVTLPIFTGLSAVVIVRSICEHHGKSPENRWTNTRGMEASTLLGFLWSNTQYHLEHHLYPGVPFHRMPKLRRLLREEYPRRGAVLEKGYARTALRLLGERNAMNVRRT